MSGLWVPLESDPEVFNSFNDTLGGPRGVKFVDLYALEDWAIELIAKPVIGLVMVMPLTDKIRTRYSGLNDMNSDTNKDVWFAKQSIPNACGAMAIFHTLMNLDPSEFPPADENGAWAQLGSTLRSNSTAEGRGDALKQSDSLAAVHEQHALAGQTRVPDDLQVLEHFVAFVQVKGHIYELDGTREGPVDHGPVKGSFLETLKPIVQSILELDPSAVNFSLLAVCKE